VDDEEGGERLGEAERTGAKDGESGGCTRRSSKSRTREREADDSSFLASISKGYMHKSVHISATKCNIITKKHKNSCISPSSATFCRNIPKPTCYKQQLWHWRLQNLRSMANKETSTFSNGIEGIVLRAKPNKILSIIAADRWLKSVALIFIYIPRQLMKAPNLKHTTRFANHGISHTGNKYMSW
jgi:hypothetical protein